jgi:hypothetical protein
LRKLLTGALAASAVLALSMPAMANAAEATLKASVKPTKAGTKKKPANTTFKIALTLNKPLTTVEFIDLTLPQALKISGKGLKKCNPDLLAAQGPSACAAAKAGPSGTASAVQQPTGGAPVDLPFVVTPFVKDSDELIFYVATKEGSGVFVQSPITGKISGGGHKLRIQIPQVLRQPGGTDASLTGLSQTFKAKQGKNYLFSSTGCKGGKHVIGGKLTFATRIDGAAVPAPVSTKANAKCSK